MNRIIPQAFYGRLRLMSADSFVVDVPDTPENVRAFGRPGSGETQRLLTTLLDERQYPAKDLIVLYHERWEQELVYDELKTHQRERPVLHSQTSAGVVQE